MVNTRALARALAMRTEIVLSQEEHPRQAMWQIEGEAYSAGLLLETVRLETNSPEEFSRQLWMENPAADNWIGLKHEGIKNPLLIRDMSDLYDVLGA
jgi:hypothetical protein